MTGNTKICIKCKQETDSSLEFCEKCGYYSTFLKDPLILLFSKLSVINFMEIHKINFLVDALFIALILIALIKFLMNIICVVQPEHSFAFANILILNISSFCFDIFKAFALKLLKSIYDELVKIDLNNSKL